MGVELAKSSFQKILHPEEVEFSVVAVVILLCSIAVKFYMSLYNKRIGKKINSAAMVATGIDSLSDTLSTAAVLVAMLVGKVSGLMIDGWVGMLVALFILYSACRAALETVGPLLGQAPEEEFVQQIQELVLAHEAVCGIHDLVVHDYGPGRVMVSLHAEVPASGDILELHDMIDGIEMELRQQLDCEAVIHMDPIVTDDALTMELRMKMATLVKEVHSEATIHDFRMTQGETVTNLIFDLVVPADSTYSVADAVKAVEKEIKQRNEHCFAVIRGEHPYV
jgi:cation diffusion facilitator family transporter